MKRFSILLNLGLFLGATEKILDNFKRKIFPKKNLDKTPIPTPTGETKSKPTPEPTVFDIKLCGNFINKVENDEKI